MKQVILALMLAGSIGCVSAESSIEIEKRLCKNFGEAVEITHSHMKRNGRESAAKLWASPQENAPILHQTVYLRWATSVHVMADVLEYTPITEVAHLANHFCIMQEMPRLIWRR